MRGTSLAAQTELGRYPGRGHGHPLQYTCLENPHGQRSLVGYSPWSPKELDTTEQLSTHTDKPSGRGVEERPSFGARSLGLSAEPALSCVTLSQSLSPSEPQFLPLQNGNQTAYLTGLLQRWTLKWVKASGIWQSSSFPICNMGLWEPVSTFG